MTAKVQLCEVFIGFFHKQTMSLARFIDPLEVTNIHDARAFEKTAFSILAVRSSKLESILFLSVLVFIFSISRQRRGGFSSQYLVANFNCT